MALTRLHAITLSIFKAGFSISDYLERALLYFMLLELPINEIDWFILRFWLTNFEIEGLVENTVVADFSTFCLLVVYCDVTIDGSNILYFFGRFCSTIFYEILAITELSSILRVFV